MLSASMRQKKTTGRSYIYFKGEIGPMGKFNAISQQIEEMGTLVLPHLQQHSDTVWSFMYRSPKTNLVQSKYFIARNKDSALKRMNEYLIEIITKGDLKPNENY